MINAEEIKALMAKDSLNDEVCHKLNYDKLDKHGLSAVAVSVGTVRTEYIKALSTLQTLLNQAAEALGRCRGDYTGLIKVCRHYSLHASYRDATESLEYIKQALAAIEPYITSGDTNDR